MSQYPPSLDEELLRNRHDQARFRLGICAFMGVCFLVTGYASNYLYLLFVVYSLALLASAYVRTRFSKAETVCSLLLDNFFTVAGLHITGQQGTFLFIFLIQISFGYGLRFGRIYLLASLLVACTGVLALYLWSPTWKGNIPLAFAYSVGTPFIGFYVYYLVERIRRSQLESELRAHEIKRLLAFVAHDIRTPLHALLATITAARDKTLEDHTRARLVRMEASVKSIAGMATEVLGAAQLGRHQLSPSVSPVDTVRWLIGLVETFRDDLTSNQTVLKYDLDMTVWPRVLLSTLSIERLLLNSLSNAVRHAHNGDVKVSLRASVQDGESCNLIVTVRNRQRRNESLDLRCPVSDDASSERIEQYHGARLGLEVASDLAQSIGGSFEFSRDVGAEAFVTTITWPCVKAGPAASRLALPVVLLSRDLELGAHVREALASETNVVVMTDIAGAAEFLCAGKPPIAALMIDAELASPSAVHTIPQLGIFSVIPPPHAAIDEKWQAAAFSLLMRVATSDMILNTAMAQDAIRENLSLLDVDTRLIIRDVLRGVRVLAVDDNDLNSAILAEGARESGVILRTVRSTDEARAALSMQAYDAVLVDWNLGARSGLELIDHLTATGTTAGPAIFVLSSTSSALIAATINSKTVTIIERPVAIETIVKTISNRLRTNWSNERFQRQLTGTQVFTIELYEDLLASGSTKTSVIALLDRFTREMQDLLSKFRAILQTGSRSAIATQAHSVQSMSHAAGAHELGDFFQFVSSGYLGQDASPASDNSAIVDTADKLWVITLAHVRVFRMALVDGRHPAQ